MLKDVATTTKTAAADSSSSSSSTRRRNGNNIFAFYPNSKDNIWFAFKKSSPLQNDSEKDKKTRFQALNLVDKFYLLSLSSVLWMCTHVMRTVHWRFCVLIFFKKKGGRSKDLGFHDFYYR